MCSNNGLVLFSALTDLISMALNSSIVARRVEDIITSSLSRTIQNFAVECDVLPSKYQQARRIRMKRGKTLSCPSFFSRKRKNKNRLGTSILDFQHQNPQHQDHDFEQKVFELGFCLPLLIDILLSLVAVTFIIIVYFYIKHHSLNNSI
jgi:hypothetical protein